MANNNETLYDRWMNRMKNNPIYVILAFLVALLSVVASVVKDTGAFVGAVTEKPAIPVTRIEDVLDGNWQSESSSYRTIQFDKINHQLSTPDDVYQYRVDTLQKTILVDSPYGERWVIEVERFGSEFLVLKIENQLINFRRI